MNSSSSSGMQLSDQRLGELEHSMQREVDYYSSEQGHGQGLLLQGHVEQYHGGDMTMTMSQDYTWDHDESTHIGVGMDMCGGHHGGGDSMLGVAAAEEEEEVGVRVSAKDAASIQAAVEKAMEYVMPGSDESPSLAILRAVKASSFQNKGLSADDKMRPSQLTCVTGRATQPGRAVLTPKKPVDYALSLGRSFRIGWARDGRFVHSGKAALPEEGAVAGAVGAPGQLVVESIACKSSASASSHEAFVACLYTLQTLCTPSGQGGHGGKGGESPQWQVPRANPEFPEEYHRFARLLKELQSCVQRFAPSMAPTLLQGKSDAELLCDPFWTLKQSVALLDAVVGQEEHFITSNPRYSFMPLFVPGGGGGMSLAGERRRNFIGQWLGAVSAVLHDSPSWSTNRRVFNDLACGRVDDAMDKVVAEDGFRLASLISQATSDKYARSYLEQQVATWDVSEDGHSGGMGGMGGMPGGSGVALDADLMDVYRLLVGFVGSIDCMGDHTWLRALSAIFLYRSTSEVEGEGREPGLPVQLDEAFNYYNVSLSEGGVQPPDSAGGVTFGDSNQHALYSLLGVLLSGDGVESDAHAYLLSALESGAFSPQPLDYSGPMLTQLLLQCCSKSSGASTHAAIVRQHAISQLLCGGEWGMACFVALHIEDPISRDYSVRDILLRWADLSAPPAAFTALTQDAQDQQHMLANVRDALHVPHAWFHESTSYSRCHALDGLQQAHHLSHCEPGLKHGVARLVCSDLFSRLDLRTHASSLKVLLEQCVLSGHYTPDRWSRGCAVIRDYLVFRESCLAQKAGRRADAGAGTTEHAKRLLTDLEELQLWSDTPCDEDSERKRGRARIQEVAQEVYCFLLLARERAPTTLLDLNGPLPLGRDAQLDALASLNRSFLRAELA